MSISATKEPCLLVLMCSWCLYSHATCTRLFAKLLQNRRRGNTHLLAVAIFGVEKHTQVKSRRRVFNMTFQIIVCLVSQR